MHPPGPDYGLDAPGVVRNLFIAATAGLLTWITAASGLWSGVLVVPLSGVRINITLGSSGLWLAMSCGLAGGWMIYSSYIGKLRERDRLLDRIAWRGTERVLDVGCGRGLLLVGAARRLTTGRAVGIDRWQAEDLSGNHPAATVENARRERVADRVAVETADMRSLPFPDATFDVVVSRAAIHNLYSASDRFKAIREIARVLKPGGCALIDDIRHAREYSAAFAGHGCTDIRQIGSPIETAFWTLLTFGSVRPATLLVRKSA